MRGWGGRVCETHPVLCGRPDLRSGRHSWRCVVRVGRLHGLPTTDGAPRLTRQAACYTVQCAWRTRLVSGRLIRRRPSFCGAQGLTVSHTVLSPPVSCAQRTCCSLLPSFASRIRLARRPACCVCILFALPSCPALSFCPALSHSASSQQNNRFHGEG